MAKMPCGFGGGGKGVAAGRNMVATSSGSSDVLETRSVRSLVGLNDYALAFLVKVSAAWPSLPWLGSEIYQTTIRLRNRLHSVEAIPLEGSEPHARCKEHGTSCKPACQAPAPGLIIKLTYWIVFEITTKPAPRTCTTKLRTERGMRRGRPVLPKRSLL
eukprot:SAG11_NODE_80_length_17731_cov_13.985254_2_plen_159_part_00